MKPTPCSAFIPISQTFPQLLLLDSFYVPPSLVLPNPDQDTGVFKTSARPIDAMLYRVNQLF